MGVTTFEVLNQLEAKDVYLARVRIEIRFGMTHFISLEIKGSQAIEKLQHDLEEVEGIGKPAKEHQLHITIGVLNIPEEDMEEVERKFHKMLEVYKDILKSRVVKSQSQVF